MRTVTPARAGRQGGEWRLSLPGQGVGFLGASNSPMGRPRCACRARALDKSIPRRQFRHRTDAHGLLSPMVSLWK
jgi:hypothetical protein